MLEPLRVTTRDTTSPRGKTAPPSRSPARDLQLRQRSRIRVLSRFEITTADAYLGRMARRIGVKGGRQDCWVVRIVRL